MRYIFLLFAFFGPLFSEQIDVIIPVHKKDAKSLDIVIDKVNKYVENVRRIIVISKKRFTLNAEWVDEKDFPFSIVDVADEIGDGVGVGDNIRRGWYYQQLLKLYAHYVIDDLEEHVLILDADTVPTRKLEFIDEEGRAILDAHSHCTFIKNYRPHAKAILPEGIVFPARINPVVHHMVLSRTIIDSLFDNVEERFEKPFWKVFCNLVIHPDICGEKVFYTGASEYVIYYFFAQEFHADKIQNRYIRTYDNSKDLAGGAPYWAYFMSKHNYDRRE